MPVKANDAPVTGSNAIQIRNVEKRYDGTQVLFDVNIRVEPGELFTILGPSGSGKTTLLSLIAGLTSPSRGRLLFGDHDVTDLAPADRGIGIVFQNYALFPHMTVFDNVAFPLLIRKLPRNEITRRVDEMLEMVQLSAVRDRQPFQLSGGQQQRVALARALVFRPSIVLLDEPLGALDRQLRETLQVELKELQRMLGVTMVLVTHDQEEALSLSDRLVVIDKGRVQQIATPSEAYLRPANAFVATFLGIANFVVIADGRSAVVRPERMQVMREGSGLGEAGRLRHSVYLGQFVRHYIALDRGKEIVASVPSAVAAASYELGARVSVSWRPEDAWCCV